MSDIYCAICGEPWDAYGVYHGDMDEDERSRFLSGAGCPCCRFGHKTSANDRGSVLQQFMREAESEIAASDEEPLTILRRRGLL